MEQLLFKAMKVAEQAEIFRISSLRTTVHFEANRLKQVQTRESASIALRIFREGKIGFAQAGGLMDTGSLLDMAVETSQFGPPARFQFPSAEDYPGVDIFDPEIERVTMEEMAGMGRELIARITGHTPDILCDASVTRGMATAHILNSQGGRASYEKSSFSLGVEGVLIRGEDVLFVGDSEGSCRLPAGVGGLADSVIRQLEWAREEACVSTKPMPVIFTPSGVASALLGPLILAFNGRTVLEGTSPLKGNQGKRLFDARFSLRDDATIARGTGSSPCDDEGVSSRSLLLIENGRVSNFLYDLQTAAMAGTQSTGHGRRAGVSFPRPATSSVIISEGDASFERMVADMREGLIVEQLIGAEQGNLLGGDFSGNVLLGYKVENGKIAGRVKDAMISGNVYEILGELVGIGDRARWVEGVLRTPHLYCPRISVVAREGKARRKER